MNLSVLKDKDKDLLRKNTQDDVLFFYSKSANKPVGKGVHEKVNNSFLYTQLNEIFNWRHVLSNFYVHDFVFEDKIYNTAEHAFQAKKIELVSKEKAFLFCKNSNSELSFGNGEEARKNRKMVLLTNEQLKIWDSIKFNVLENILRAKFTQIPIAEKVLLATNYSQLLHGTRGTPIHRQIALEKVRCKLLKKYVF